MEQQQERVTFRWQIGLLNHEFLNIVNRVLNNFHAKVGENRIQTHDWVATHIRVAVIQISNHTVNQVLNDWLHVDLGNQAQGSTPNEFIWRLEVFSESIDSESDLIFDSAVDVGLLDDLPVKEQ